MFYSKIKCALFSAILIATIHNVNATDILKSGQTLSNDNYIQSPNGNYTLIMQTDGSLVMYRRDGTIRYRMEKHGSVAVMQIDGNFVEYYNNTALWATYTFNVAGWPSNNLYITDSGDLKIIGLGPVYSWHIGDDPNPSGVGSSQPGMTALVPPGPPPVSIPTVPRAPEFDNTITSNMNPRY